jgi:putative membrane protein
MNKRQLYLSSVVIIFYLVGTFGTILKFSHDFFLDLFPFALLLSFTLLFFSKGTRPVLKDFLVMAGIAAISFFIEAAGVSSGLIFGVYSYGDTLGVKLLETPLIIGLNWTLLVLASASVAEALKVPVPVKVLLASVIMVVYDVAMEQVAGILDMWTWQNNSIPPRNYLGWFVTALILHSFVKVSGIKTDYKLSAVVLITQFSFFLLLLILLN